MYQNKLAAAVVSLDEYRKRAEAHAAVKGLMCAIATLSGEIKRLEKVFDRYGQ